MNKLVWGVSFCCFRWMWVYLISVNCKMYCFLVANLEVMGNSMLTCKPVLVLWREVTAAWTLQPCQTNHTACLGNGHHVLSDEPVDFEK